MKRNLIALACGIVFSAAQTLTAADDAKPAKPNILFILTDDMGWGDLGCYGNTELATLNIDRLAKEGTRFTQFYVASPICSPSRTAFLTGCFPARWKINDYLHNRAGNQAHECVNWLDPKAPTLARTLHDAGYATAHFGKWHMGGGRDVQDAPLPKEYGYDEHHVNIEGCGPRINSFGFAKPELVDGKMLARYEFTGFWADKSMDFIKRHKDKPFFVEFWPQDVHTPHTPDPEELPHVAQTPQSHQKFNAVLRRYDREIGRVLDFLKAEGLDKNTVVIFASDNGPEPSFQRQRTGGLRGMKWSLYEGGIREPFLVRWPGHVPANATDTTTVLGSIDFFPTVCALAGIPMPVGATVDGFNASGVWTGVPVKRDKPLFWEYGRKADYLFPREPGARSPNLAVRDGNLKLLINADGTGAELYDLAVDPNETTNLAAQKTDDVARLSALVVGWRKSLP
ncbi:MAG: sulfatase-like hydrolase/transferase [Planctomycetota bacterium]